MLVPLTIPPGIFRNGTNYQAAGRWYDGDLVRFYRGAIMPEGGWLKAASSAVSGKARGIHTWLANDGDRWAAVGTHTGLYAFNGGSIYNITPVGFTAGREDSFDGLGYGYGFYGAGPYGVKPAVTSIIDAATWTLDNWGQYLVACMNEDGIIYTWELDPVTLPLALTNAPVDNQGVFVTPERAVVAYGAGGVPRRVKWADGNDYTIWTAASNNTAGEKDIESKGKLNGHVKVREGTLLSTGVDIHLFEFVGSPFIYGIRKVSDACGFLGKHAGVSVEGGAFWMGQNSFFFYDGTVKALPSDVGDYVFKDINRVQGAKVYAGHNPTFGEVKWFYPSANSTEVNRSVSFNYRENHWNIGSMTRTAWAETGVFNNPLAVGTDGYIYQHELGWTADGTPITTGRFLEAGPVEIDRGNKVLHINQLLPDENTVGQVQVRFGTKFTPLGTEYDLGPYSMAPYSDMRVTGRQIAPRIEGLADADWRVGTFRFEVKTGGRR